jgi:hypothetical protein
MRGRGHPSTPPPVKKPKRGSQRRRSSPLEEAAEKSSRGSSPGSSSSDNRPGRGDERPAQSFTEGEFSAPEESGAQQRYMMATTGQSSANNNADGVSATSASSSPLAASRTARGGQAAGMMGRRSNSWWETHRENPDDDEAATTDAEQVWHSRQPTILPPPTPLVPPSDKDAHPPMMQPHDPITRVVQLLLATDGARANVDAIAAHLEWETLYEPTFGDLRDFLQLYSSLIVVSPIGGMVTFRDAAKFVGSRRVTKANRNAILSLSASIGHVSCTSVCKRIKLPELQLIFRRRGLESTIIHDSILHVAYPEAFDLFVFEEGAVVWWGQYRSDHWVVDADFINHNHVTAPTFQERHDSADINALFPIWWTYSMGAGQATPVGLAGHGSAVSSGAGGGAGISQPLAGSSMPEVVQAVRRSASMGSAGSPVGNSNVASADFPEVTFFSDNESMGMKHPHGALRPPC